MWGEEGARAPGVPASHVLSGIVLLGVGVGLDDGDRGVGEDEVAEENGVRGEGL